MRFSRLLLFYFLRTVGLRFVLALPGLSLVYLSFELGDQGRHLASLVGWPTTLWAVCLHVPLIAVQLFPVALLLAGILALAHLRGRGELSAMSAAGVGPLAFCAPLLLGGLLCGVLAFALDELVVPPAERRVDRLFEGRKVSTLTGLRTPPRWMRHDAWFLHLEADGESFLALRLDPRFRLLQRVERRRGAARVGEQGRQRSTVFSATGALARGDIPTELLSFESRAAEVFRRARPEAQDALALRRQMHHLAQAGQLHPVETLVFHTKLAFPWFNLVVALLLCSVAMDPRRRSLVKEMAVGSGLLFGLWLLLALGWLGGRVGWISPVTGAWGPLLLGILLGGLLLFPHVRRTREGHRGASCK